MDVSCRLEHRRLAWGIPRELHVLAVVETWPEEGGTVRKPLNLSIVLDRSGSMGGEKLARTQSAVKQLVNRLAPDDFLSVVAFNQVAEIVVPHGPVLDRAAVASRVDSILADGNTNLSAGWTRGIGLVLDAKSAERIHRVILLTDGIANEGVVGQDGLSCIAREAAAQGVTSTAIGFGSDFNEKDLTAIAREGQGRFYYVDSPDAAPNVFLEEFGELARVFGQNLEVALSCSDPLPAPEVLSDLRFERKERAAIVRVGDVLEHDRRQVLFRIALPAVPRPEGGPAAEREVAALSVRYDAVRGKFGPRSHALPVRVAFSDEGPDEPDAGVLREASMARLAHWKREAAARAESQDFEGARRILQKGLEDLAQARGIAPEAVAREEKELRGVLDMIGRREAPRVSKSLRTQVADWSVTRVGYSVPPELDKKRFILSPSRPEQVDDVAEALEKSLAALGYGADRIPDAVFVLRELASNAIGHGCKGASNPRVEIAFKASPNYVTIAVEDNGPGFDAKALLARLSSEKGAEPAGRRGRGLHAVRKMAFRLSFNEAGNRVEAVLRRKGLKFAVDRKIRVSRNGVTEVPILKVSGAVDNHTFDDLSDQIHAVLDRGLRSMLLDLSEVDYISSSGVGVLAEAAHSCSEQGGVCVLAGVRKNVVEVLELMGLSQLLHFADGVDQAIDKYDF
jgi:anti-anti-sigma factor